MKLNFHESTSQATKRKQTELYENITNKKTSSPLFALLNLDSGFASQIYQLPEIEKLIEDA